MEVRRAMQAPVEGFLDSEVNNAKTLRSIMRTPREASVVGSERRGERVEDEIREVGGGAVKLILAGYCEVCI